jgi:hypothetical protein
VAESKSALDIPLLRLVWSNKKPLKTMRSALLSFFAGSRPWKLSVAPPLAESQQSFSFFTRSKGFWRKDEKRHEFPVRFSRRFWEQSAKEAQSARREHARSS